jgi:hypothetical protein
MPRSHGTNTITLGVENTIAIIVRHHLREGAARTRALIMRERAPNYTQGTALSIGGVGKCGTILFCCPRNS